MIEFRTDTFKLDPYNMFDFAICRRFEFRPTTPLMT